jgi:hypothetical protein
MLMRDVPELEDTCIIRSLHVCSGSYIYVYHCPRGDMVGTALESPGVSGGWLLDRKVGWSYSAMTTIIGFIQTRWSNR